MQRIQPSRSVPLREALAQALRHSDAARFLQRLHAVLLVCAGQSCTEVAHWLDHSPRTIERWARAYESGGVQQLRVTHSGGRPGSLRSPQREMLWADIARVPSEFGYRYSRWSGKLLAMHLARQYGLNFSTRQCQRWLSNGEPKALIAPPAEASAGATADLALTPGPSPSMPCGADVLLCQV